MPRDAPRPPALAYPAQYPTVTLVRTSSTRSGWRTTSVSCQPRRQAPETGTSRTTLRARVTAASNAASSLGFAPRQARATSAAQSR